MKNSRWIRGVVLAALVISFGCGPTPQPANAASRHQQMTLGRVDVTILEGANVRVIAQIEGYSSLVAIDDPATGATVYFTVVDGFNNVSVHSPSAK